MTRRRHGRSALEFPTPLEVVHRREFRAPMQLVFDVFTKPEHVRRTMTPFGEQVTVCEIDLRVGGDYHYAFVTDDGVECSFRGTFLELDPPRRTVQTWLFDGWPDAPAVETLALEEIEGGTRLTSTLAFRDQAGRDHMTRYDGSEAQLELVADYLDSLLADDDAPARATTFVRRFDHVGITVADLDTVSAFFVGLGLEVENRMFVEGDFLDTVIGIPDSRTEIVMLKLPDGGTTLELSSFSRPDHLPGSPAAPANELGLRNVAFEVADLQGAVGWAARQGYGLVGGIGEYERFWRMAYVRGPEGIIVSLAERIG